ncbi:hypothetical protein JXI42_00045 [bacterium]|nr:hypothetical protein [bacterium]
MNSRLKYFGIILLLLSIKVGFTTQLAELIPGEPLLYIEFKDLGEFLEQYESSELKRDFQGSENYQDFTKSKLYLKLNNRFDELSSLIDLSIDLDALSSLGGENTGFALYDIGELQFLMVLEVSADKWLKSKLYDKTKYFEPRTAGDLTYFVKQDEGGSMEFAFCEIGKRVFISNQLEKLLEALQLEKKESRLPSLNETDKFKQFESVISEQKDREFFLYLKQAEITANSYFRTYWLYQNFGDLGWIDRALIFLVKENGGIRELRYFSSGDEFSAQTPDIKPLIEKFSKSSKLLNIAQFKPVSAKVIPAFFGNKTGIDKFAGQLTGHFETADGDYYVYLLTPKQLESENFFYTYSRCLMLHCGTGPGNHADWTSLVSEFYNSQFVVSPGIEFEDLGSGLYRLELPLTEDLYLTFRDEWVCFSNDRAVLEGLDFPTIVETDAPFTRYLELDYGYMSDFTLQTISKLVNKSAWTYFDSGKFFEDNITSLIRTTSRIKTFKLKQRLSGNLIEEEVIYLYK